MRRNHFPRTPINHTFRIRIITVIVALLASGIFVRLYYLQVLQHERFSELAQRQYTRLDTNVFKRGGIFFTTKDGALVSGATVKNGYVLAINPQLLQNPEAVYERLSAYVPVDREWFIERATWSNRTYIELPFRLDGDVATQIAAERLIGLSLHRDQWRFYPGGDVAARTLGFVGFTDESQSIPRGVYGLERYYDEILRRESEQKTVNIFAEIFGSVSSANLASVSAADSTNSSLKSGDVITTIEPTVARMLDRVLADTHDKYDSALTGGIIMDPQTGAVYALNTVPTYDLNDRSDVPVSQFRNPLVEDVYEMGSIMKALTLAAGLDAKAITPSTTYYDSGEVRLDNFTIRNYDGKGRGTVDMQTVIGRSLNTGVSFIVDQMGRDRFREYFLNLRLGSESGIDLPSEGQGLVANLQSPRRVEYATASFGQGIATTPIATVRALAALGNGGYLVTPHLASEIRYSDGTVRDVTYPKGVQVWSEETSETVSRMLVRVVDEVLKNGTVALPHHTIAAKTGTAQIAKPTGGYFDDRYLHSFFGYFPAYDPRFIVLLYTVEPKGVQYASETLTDPFMEVTKFLINYYSIPPDR